MTDKRRPTSEPAADAFAEEDHFTPITDVLEVLESQGFVPTERERRLIHMFWRHSANMEMRGRKRSDSQDTSLLARRIDEVEASIVDLAGKSGDDGRLGALKDRVDKAEARKWWAITFIVGLIVTVIGSAFAFGSRIGALETDVETLKARALRVRANGFVFPPEFPATKEGPQ